MPCVVLACDKLYNDLWHAHITEARVNQKSHQEAIR